MGLISRLFESDRISADDERQIAEVAAQNELRQSYIEALKAWRPAGTSIRYLGRECCVVSHQQNESAGLFCISFAALKVQYADDIGKIHDLTLTGDQAFQIMKEQP